MLSCVSQSSPRRLIFSQVTPVTGLLTQLLLYSFLSWSHFPSLQPVFPGITSQRNFLHLNLRLRVCFWKIFQAKIILSTATLVRSFPLISLMVLYIPWLASSLQSLFLPFLPLVAPRSSFFLKHCSDVSFPLLFYYYSHCSF